MSDVGCGGEWQSSILENRCSIQLS